MLKEKSFLIKGEISLKEYNVIILGAGISGISCSIYLERAGIKTLLIENNMPGGQLNKIDIIENYPGYKKITGVSYLLVC